MLVALRWQVLCKANYCFYYPSCLLSGQEEAVIITKKEATFLLKQWNSLGYTCNPAIVITMESWKECISPKTTISENYFCGLLLKLHLSQNHKVIKSKLVILWQVSKNTSFLLVGSSVLQKELVVQWDSGQMSYVHLPTYWYNPQGHLAENWKGRWKYL